MKINRYRIKGPKLKAAVVADLHGSPSAELYAALENEKPNVILIPGDLATVGEYNDRSVDPDRRMRRRKTQDGAISFLKKAVNVAPVYCSRGNHEWGDGDVYFDEVRDTGAVLLENEWVVHRPGIFIGGQNSARCGAVCRDGKKITEKTEPDTEWLKNRSPDGFRLLMCHHPEYYTLVEPYADLIVSGHTHGGQWRFFGRGVLAPNQGFLPQYSKGQYGKMIVSAGLTNTTWIPRINNPTELVVVELC